jgi:hypothetical protein
MRNRPSIAKVPNVHPRRSLQNLTFGFRCACVRPQVLCPRAYALFDPKGAGIFQAPINVVKNSAIPQHNQPNLFL